MSAAETEWQPGDPNPLVPDNGCGNFATVYMSDDMRALVLAADTDAPPPWWRPATAESINGGWTRHCKTCDVQWRGPEPCWSCDGEDGLP